MTKIILLSGVLALVLILIIIAIKKDFQKYQGSDFKKDIENYMLEI